MGARIQHIPVIVPSHIENVIEPVIMLVAEFRNMVFLYADNTTQVRLKARLGNNEVYNNGITSTYWQQMLLMFSNCTEWTEPCDLEWKHMHDYYYSLNDGTRVHTITVFETHADPLLDVQHFTEAKVADITICATGAYRLSIDLLKEVSVSPNDLPEIVVPSRVCIRARRSFVYKFWRFDLTQRWTGASRLLAERAQQLGVASYDIELECISPLEYLRMTPDNYIATSILLKLSDLLPHTLGTFSVVPPTPL